MPGAVRTNKKAAKIAYKLLRIPKEKQQNSKPPALKLRKEWFSDLSNAQ